MAVLNVNVDFLIIIGETQEVYGLPLYLIDIFNDAEQTIEIDASHADGVLFLFIIEFLNTSVREGDILSFPEYPSIRSYIGKL
ncbi:hypothetical protein [Peribacillus simplex]|uniref:hypothetical protein n=1 Tax=Peribacillus simplex TaxID=1478 RepID=UPI00366E2540